MRLTCQACQAETSLEAAIGREADARAMASFIEAYVPLGALLVRYLGLFRPANRRLSLARTVALFDELLPDLQRAAITRKGRDWAAPHELWRVSIEHVLAMRDKGSLTLPLSGHGYLYEVLAGHADKAEALTERAQLQAGRQRVAPAFGQVDAPVAVAAVVQAVGSSPAAPASLPYDMAKGPSRAALALQAQIKAAQAARHAPPGEGDDNTEPEPVT